VIATIFGLPMLIGVFRRGRLTPVEG